MGWCRGGKVNGWADGKAGAGARLAAGLTAKQVPGLAATARINKL